MKKVLILTAAFGDGHNTAAGNIRDALEFISDDVRVEVLDLFESSYGSLYSLARKTHLGIVQYVPKLWEGIYSLLDHSSVVSRNMERFSKLRCALEDVLNQTQPDCVVSTYPIYGHIIAQVFQDHKERPFRLITVITDSTSVNSTWFRAPSDFLCVADESTAEVLRKAGVAEDRIEALGFPVSYRFAETQRPQIGVPRLGEIKRILYLINSGRKKAGKVIDRLLEHKDVVLTVTVGRDPQLKAKLMERTAWAGDRVRVLGWTNQMPELMMSNHLVIGKAGGAVVQEAVAAHCPIIVNQIIPGQEEGNARLIRDHRLGAIAEDESDVIDQVATAFSHRARIWTEWKANMARASKPDAALRIADLILAQCDEFRPNGKRISLFETNGKSIMRPTSDSSPSRTKLLLCDFHIHTNYSDGKLTLPEVIDFYGRLGFDCICITDHLADQRRLIGKLAELSNFTLSQDQLPEYFEVLERERRRAWRKYSMLVMTGIEFNKDGFSKKSSAHLLGIDLTSPICASLDLPETIARIHQQDGLAVASHPHMMKSEWGKNTLYLWHHQEEFAPLLDAWEIANRNNLFAPIGLKNLPFIANSDFHKPKHIFSWKTLLHCEKETDAIKQCIRKNQDVAITLYRDFNSAESLKRGFCEEKHEHDLNGLESEIPLEVASRH